MQIGDEWNSARHLAPVGPPRPPAPPTRRRGPSFDHADAQVEAIRHPGCHGALAALHDAQLLKTVEESGPAAQPAGWTMAAA